MRGRDESVPSNVLVLSSGNEGVLWEFCDVLVRNISRENLSCSQSKRTLAMKPITKGGVGG